MVTKKYLNRVRSIIDDLLDTYREVNFERYHSDDLVAKALKMIGELDDEIEKKAQTEKPDVEFREAKKSTSEKASYEEKFVVVHKKRLAKLTPVERKLFGRLVDKMGGDNKYYVCNQDEPYAETIIKIILLGENRKKGVSHCDWGNNMVDSMRVVVGELMDRILILDPEYYHKSDLIAQADDFCCLLEIMEYITSMQIGELKEMFLG